MMNRGGRRLGSIVAALSVQMVLVLAFGLTSLATTDPLPAGAPDANWLTAVQRQIADAEYGVTWQNQTARADIAASWQAPNRENGFRTHFTEQGIRVIPRLDERGDWEWGLSLWGYGRGGETWPVSGARLYPSGNRVDYQRGALAEWYLNSPRGLEQGFVLPDSPEAIASDTNTASVSTAVPGRGRAFPPKSLVHLDLELLGGLHPTFSTDGQAIDFSTRRGVPVVHFSELKVTDAKGRQLLAWMEGVTLTRGRGIRIVIDDRDAVYPITIDPLATSASWTVTGEQTGAEYAKSLATAGDVNADGYSDVIVAAHLFDTGQVDAGKVWLYFGSAMGLSTTAAWTAEGDQAFAHFGSAVATAGDVNGDGYSDVLIGADHYSNGETDEGRAYVYHGSANGLTGSAWTADGQQESAHFGFSVATAGDVNHDGFSDIIVGAPLYDSEGGLLDVGRTEVYLGSPTAGLSPTPTWTHEGEQAGIQFGSSVATAGDVNGDGFSDVIVGAPYYDRSTPSPEADIGLAQVFLGSAAGLSSTDSWHRDGWDAGGRFGTSVGTAGDVNGDGYSDVIVGAPRNGNGSTSLSTSGRATVYHGSATGLSLYSRWFVDGDQMGAHLGQVVATAGDVNGDGFSDVIVGAPAYNRVTPPATDIGLAQVYFGSAAGLSRTTPAWTKEGEQAGDLFGWAVATAGDVNGDGFSDVILGALCSNIGRAYVYLGSSAGPSTTETKAIAGIPADQFAYSVATAGDVNGDGYADVIIGAPYFDSGQPDVGRAFVYHGSASGLASDEPWTAAWTSVGLQAYANFGYSVATAGDVNADGYSDVIIGAPNYLKSSPGSAYIYLGSTNGLSATSSWTGIGEQVGSRFGLSVATAGDTNGDGYADVVIGAPGFDSDSGKAYVYHGSSTGFMTSAWRPQQGYYGHFGWSVATAGDVDGDGYADVIVGAPRVTTLAGVVAGRVQVFRGPSGTLHWTADGDQPSSSFGYSVAAAGDVNGDGYSDVVVGTPYYNTSVGPDSGRVQVFSGSSSGLPTPPVASWTSPPGEEVPNARLGSSVASAGDVNGDGYSDVIIGAPTSSRAFSENGTAAVYLGSAAGLSPSKEWGFDGKATGVRFGTSVATAGDVNGDGYADVVVGTTSGGEASVFAGNGGAGLALRPQQRRGDDLAPISHGGILATPSQIRLSSLGRSPLGRGEVKLEWELKTRGDLFDGSGTGKTSEWIGVGPAPASFNELISGLESGDYHWRARLLYNPVSSPFQQKSRWLTVPWNGWNEADFSSPLWIGGAVWNDQDGDGIRDQQEPGIMGWEVQLLTDAGTIIRSTSTREDGVYSFEVGPSSYRVRFADESGYVFTVRDQGGDDAVDSDANTGTGETQTIIPPHDVFDVTGWSAGLMTDVDGDSVGGPVDNCPILSNPSQTDSDGDGVGDVCDNCASISNSSQSNADGDQRGDACDNCPSVPNDQQDSDGDAIGDACDNCRALANPEQTNADADAWGDACDNCPALANDQSDLDGDAVGDACDWCTDSDGDGFGNPGFLANHCAWDNCPSVPNSQANADGDSYGDACDSCTDTDGDGFGDPGFPANTCTRDNCPYASNANQGDYDNDSVGDSCDICSAGPDSNDCNEDGRPDACEINPVWMRTGDVYSPSGSPDNESFGHSVALAPGGSSFGVVGDPLNGDFGYQAGIAWLADAQSGTLLNQLIPPSPTMNNYFGASVAVNEYGIAVGAFGAGQSAGVVYRYGIDGNYRGGEISSPEATAGDEFGYSIALSGARMVVGAPSDDGVGSAWVFRCENEYGCTEAEKLTPPTPSSGLGFGRSVATDGAWVVVGSSNGAFVYQCADVTGCWLVHELATVPGSGYAVAISDTEGLVVVSHSLYQGSVHVFDLYSGAELDVLRPLAQEDVNFGWSVALDGSRIVVGAPRPSPQTSAVYWFVRDGATWRPEDRAIVGGTTVTNFGPGMGLALQGDRTWSRGGGMVAMHGWQPASTTDCDGNLVPDSCEPDTDGDTIIDACEVCAPGVSSSPEQCDGIDNDCDGVVDDGGGALCDDGDACSTNVCNGAAGCETTSVSLSIPDTAVGAPGSTQRVPVIAVPGHGIGFDLTVTWDPTVLTALGVNTTDITLGFALSSQLTTPGEAVIALYGANPPTGSGAIVEIEFSVVGAGEAWTPVNLVRGDINEGRIKSCLDSGAFHVCSSASDNVCNGVDDDCDGQADEDFEPAPTTCGVGACASTGSTSCVNDSPGDSCTPGTPAANDATCDGIDDDCSGSTDEDYGVIPTTCGVGACAATGTLACVAGHEVVTCVEKSPSAEICNNIDDDCNGAVDDLPGGCVVTGTVRYYREGTTEPSTKGTPGVGIDVSNDTTPEGVTDAAGAYGVSNLFGYVTVTTTPRWEDSRPPEDRVFVTSYDAQQIAEHAVGLSTLSSNQQIAGDVTGNGILTSFDAAMVAQHAVALIDHFEVATATGSDWKFLRCDEYASATEHTCGQPTFVHNPFMPPQVDDFYAILYGDVTGNWYPITEKQLGSGDRIDTASWDRIDTAIAAQAKSGPSGTAPGRPGAFVSIFHDEAEAAAADRAHTTALRMSPPGVVRRAVEAGPALLRIDRIPAGLAAGDLLTIVVTLENADGIEALDLEIGYDATRLSIVDVQRGSLTSAFQLIENDADGKLKVAAWGVTPLAGSGPVLILTAELHAEQSANGSFEVSASANEGRIPLRLLGTSTRPTPDRRGERRP